MAKEVQAVAMCILQVVSDKTKTMSDNEYDNSIVDTVPLPPIMFRRAMEKVSGQSCWSI